MSDEDYELEERGWRPWKKPKPRTMMGTAHLANLPDRDDLADLSYEFIATPVETETGEAVRGMALRALTSRVDTLQERGKHQRLTSIESRELMDSQSAIHTLQRMAPVGALLEARPGDLFSGNLA